MSDRVTCGVIGAGRIGQLHARLLQRRVANTTVKCVCDINLDAARKSASEAGIPCATARVEDVLGDPDIDAVVICSSTDTHASLIRQAAEKKKHIFCEKPIAFDVKVIRETLSVVQRSGVKLQIGFNRRFDPNFSRVKAVVASGQVGDVHMVRITSRDPAPPPLDYVRVSGGLFCDMTIHDFDMARFLSGSEVVEVYARGAVLVDPRIGESHDIDTAAITLVFANGALGFIDNSRKAVYGYDQRVEVFGSKGMAQADNVASNTVMVCTDAGLTRDLPPFFFIERYTESYINEFLHFIDCIRNDKHPSVSGQDGLEPVYLAQACNKSMKENRPVALSEVRQ